jgi:hypothetical protein
MNTHTCRECRDTGRVTDTPNPIWTLRNPNNVSVTDYCGCHHGWKLKADEIRAAAGWEDRELAAQDWASDRMGSYDWDDDTGDLVYTPAPLVAAERESRIAAQ